MKHNDFSQWVAAILGISEETVLLLYRSRTTEHYVSIKHASVMLGVSPRTVTRYIHNGRFENVRQVNKTGKYEILVSDVVRLLTQQLKKE